MGQFIVEDDEGIRWEPITRQMMVGRSPSSHLVLRSATASRRHAWVWQRGNQVIIEDLGSTHGTYVNGQLVTSPRSLAHNDRITIGNAQLTFIAQQGLKAEPTPQPPAVASPGDEDRTPPAGVPYVATRQLFCPHCGASNHPEESICGHCGQSLAPGPVRAESRSAEAGPAWSRHSTTPAEPVVARPFPVAPTHARRRGRAGIWAVIVLLALLALCLLAVLGFLLVRILG